MRTGLLLTQTNVNKISNVTGNSIISVPGTTGTGVAANFFSRPLKTLKAIMQYFMAAFFVGKKVSRIVMTLFLTIAFFSVIQAQTLTSDKDDYPPGSTVTLTGSGFQPDEAVTLQVTHVGDGDNETSRHTSHGL